MLLAGLVLAVLLVRLFALGSDPLAQTDTGFIYDWGEWTKNARQHALWGVWILDDYNPGYYSAFAYTLAVRLAFAMLGVGWAQMLVVNALSGVATMMVVFAMVRSATSFRVAVVAAVLAGLNPLTIVYDRSAYPESFQLVFMTLAVAGVLSERPWAMVAGGISLAMAVAAKVTGLVALPIVGLAWAVRWAWSRRMGADQRVLLAQAIRFGAAAGVVLLVYSVAFVIPNWHWIRMQFMFASVGQFSAVGAGARPGRVSLFGNNLLGLRLNGFFAMQWYLLFIGALFAMGRISRTLRQPVVQLELVCWAWFGFGMLYLARLFYQPDRRFLIVLPPLVILAALFLGRDIAFGPSTWRSRSLATAGGALAGALLCGLAAFYLSSVAGPLRVSRIANQFGMVWSHDVAAGAMVTAAVLAGALAGAIMFTRMPTLPVVRRSWLLAAVVAVIVLARWGIAMRQRTYTMAQVSAMIARLTSDWPVNDRVQRGSTAATFAMGTRNLGVGIELKGPRSFERYHPPLDLSLAQPLALPAGEAPRVDCAQIPVWPKPDGTPRYMVHLLVAPRYLTACLAASNATARATPSATVVPGSL